MRIFILSALAVLSLATCQLMGSAPDGLQASGTVVSPMGGGPIDTGGFLLYTPPGASQPDRLVGAYWRQREVDSDGATIRESVRRWTLRDVNGLDHTKVTTFHATDPMLSESAGPYVLEPVTTGDYMGDTLQAVEDIAGVRPHDDKSDVRFLFWGYNGEYDKAPYALSTSLRD